MYFKGTIHFVRCKTVFKVSFNLNSFKLSEVKQDSCVFNSLRNRFNAAQSLHHWKEIILSPGRFGALQSCCGSLKSNKLISVHLMISGDANLTTYTVPEALKVLCV